MAGKPKDQDPMIMNKTELSRNEVPPKPTKLPVLPNGAAEAGKGDEGIAACLVCQKERQFPDAIATSGKVRLYRKLDVENWINKQAENAVKE
jgi:hypothetical protein